MAKIIVTDSTSYLPSSFFCAPEIKVVPLMINFNGHIYREGIDISNHDYFSILRQEAVFPQTSQPSSGDFLSIFQQLETGDEVLVILISSCLSGTVQSALMAKNILQREDISIHIVDSLSTSAGLALQIMKACELISMGYDMDAVVAELEQIQNKLVFLFVVDDLEYLARGGRISHFNKHIGSILQIKPVLHLQEGRIEVFQKIRTRAKAVNRVIEELEIRAEQAEKVVAVHVDAFDKIEDFKSKIDRIYPGEIITAEVGPVIGSHVGPGTIGLAFY